MAQHRHLNRSTAFNATNIIQTFVYPPLYQSRNSKSECFTTNVNVWDGMGGAIFFGRRTLVFHADDAAFHHYSRLYENLAYTLICDASSPLETIIEEIKCHDAIIIIGRRARNTVINPAYTTDDSCLTPYIISPFMEAYF